MWYDSRTPGRLMQRVLYVAHNHPSVSPGGVETYAVELYRGMKTSARFEPILLSRIGAPHTSPHPTHRGTFTSSVNHDPNQYLFFTDISDFNWLMRTPRQKDACIHYYREFLESYRPELVHFQHTLFLGFDLITETRNTLPHAPIVYTLHEYLPICHNEGQMVRTKTQERCLEASPRRCHTCFPDIAPEEFFLRKQFIASHFSKVDLFLAPSRFLLERYVDWGIPREKIRFEEYGRLPSPRADESPLRSSRNRFAFFGQLTPFKGVNVLLDAMRQIDADRADSSARHRPHLWIHGANLELAADDFQEAFRKRLDAAGPNVTFLGRYDHARLPQLMASVDWVVVPSIWWENSPLVIQEAFAHGRPVICSDIGGMAEKVEHGVNGLHFHAGDPASLAETLNTAANSPELWQKLHAGIRSIHSMQQHVGTVERMYQELLGQGHA
jgi:glycosyltransferase involved in cell wall biosynthesis